MTAEEGEEWPHVESRRPGVGARLTMPMDLPCFALLAKPDSGYVLSLDAFAWGREVHVKFMANGTLKVFVKDAEGTFVVYEGERGDEGDLSRKKRPGRKNG